MVDSGILDRIDTREKRGIVITREKLRRAAEKIEERVEITQRGNV